VVYVEKLISNISLPIYILGVICTRYPRYRRGLFLRFPLISSLWVRMLFFPFFSFFFHSYAMGAYACDPLPSQRKIRAAKVGRVSRGYHSTHETATCAAMCAARRSVQLCVQPGVQPASKSISSYNRRAAARREKK
jgi:hypothetical protein